MTVALTPGINSAHSEAHTVVVIVQGLSPLSQDLVRLLQAAFDVLLVDDADAAIAAMDSHDVSVVLTDQRATSEVDDVLVRVQAHDPRVSGLRVKPFPEVDQPAGMQLDQPPWRRRRHERSVLRSVRAAVDRSRAIRSQAPDVDQASLTESPSSAVEDPHGLADFIADGVLRVDAKGTVTYANPRAEAMLGRGQTELLGRHEAKLFPEPTPGQTTPTARSPIEVAIRAASPVRDVQSRFSRADGSAFPVELSVGPIVEGDRAVGAVVTFRDVTARIDKMKEEFVSVVSHELRTPLTAIRGSLGLLAAGKGGVLSLPGRRLAAIAIDSSNRLNKLVEDLLDIEAIESGSIRFSPVACDALSLVRVAITESTGLALAGGVALSTDSVSDEVYADPDRVVQVLNKLLANAIKFSPVGGKVTVSTCRRDGMVEFSVQDHGAGIPTDKTAMIFRSFEQVDSSDTRLHGGVGLGLTICREIVHVHQGQLWVVSTLGEGSTFRFTLPQTPLSTAVPSAETDPGVLITVAEAEEARLDALTRLAILDTPREDRFDRVVRIAQRLFDVPMVGVSIISRDRQWQKATVGLDEEMARDDAFCNYTIAQPGPLVVEDATLDPRFRDNRLVTDEPSIRFYAGQPLRAPGGERVGALCIIDSHPRKVTSAELDLLRDLANWVEKELAGDDELRHLSEVQRSLLPQTAPSIAGYQIAGECFPARQARGDFFDYYMVGGDLQLCLGDAMGTGSGAAIIAAGTRAVLRGANRLSRPAEAVNQASDTLAGDLAQTSSLVGLFSARLEPCSGTLTWVDAGHGLAGIMGEFGEQRRLKSDGLPLGAVPGDTWQSHDSVMGPGDIFIAVSDGYLDYFPTYEEAKKAMDEVVTRATTAVEVVQYIATLREHHQTADDLTVLVLRRDSTAEIEHAEPSLLRLGSPAAPPLRPAVG